jgi:sugar-phosphatase
MNATHIPRPPVLITSEDVTIGNPHPQCYELAARKLGVKVKECPVFDAAAGILAARSAGARVIVVSETHISQ